MEHTPHEHNIHSVTDSIPDPAVVPSTRRTARLAWAVMVLAFGIFCTLLGSTIYTFLDYRTYATDVRTGTLIARAPLEWITWQRADRAVPERAQEEQTLNEGQSVNIVSSAGYGQVATLLLFDNSTLDMWSGASVTLQRLRTSRWNAQQQVVELRQNSGYVRYDLREGQPYANVRYVVHAGTATIDLMPGGSYSIEIVRPERRVQLTTAMENPPVLIDIAARTGSATIASADQTATILAGERVEIDPVGTLSEPMPARWQLIRDGEFSQYSAQEYNNTTLGDNEQPSLVRSDTWQVFSGSSSDDTAANGFFNVAEACRPPRTDNDCDEDERTHTAWFIRNGGQTKSFITGIRQLFGRDSRGIDISEYRSLVFSIWVRVLDQSIDLTGDEGTECPVMIRFRTKLNHPTDEEQDRLICFYASSDPEAEPVTSPNITYYRVVPYSWYPLTIDLREPEWMPEVRYLWDIEIYANGHEYDSRIAEVSLIGSHYPPRTPQREPQTTPHEDQE